MLLDTRDAAAFAAGNLIGSVNVGLEGRYAQYVGNVVGPQEQIVLLAEPGTELEARVRLGRIGYDRVAGYVENLYAAFQERPELVQVSSRLTAGAFDDRRRSIPDLQVVDVRNAGEVEAGSVPGATIVPMPRLRAEMKTLDAARPTVVYCEGGYRSSIAASMLRSAGFGDVSDVLGGYPAWAAAHARRTTSAAIMEPSQSPTS